jgi:AbrB family looped-hinge helix DNA binding protein
MHRIATVQTRGRITLPARIRQALQIAPGDNVVFVETAAGRFEVKAEARTAALLNRRPTTRLELPVQLRAPQLQLPLPASEHTAART